MGALAGLVEVAIVLVVAYPIYITVAGSTRRRLRYFPTGGRWQPHHYADGHTVVTVARMTPRER